MNLLPPNNLEVILLTGYVIWSICLNIIAYLIALFYQKKFDQPSGKYGFIIATLTSLFFIITLFAGKRGIQLFQIMSIVTLLISGVSSVISITNLYFTMRKVRK